MTPIVHPGPAHSARHVALPCHARRVSITLREGLRFGEAVAQGFAEQGAKAGYLRLCNIPMKRLCFVMPAPAPGDGHVAWYSDTHEAPGAAVIETGGTHLGLRDGAPFTHTHGLWHGPDGTRHAGHLLPDSSVIAGDTQVEGWALTGAHLVARPDPETQFTLFTPEPTEAPDTPPNALLCMLRPHEDITRALDMLADTHVSTPVKVEGIGSLIGTHFETSAISSYATEVLLTGGQAGGNADPLEALSVGIDGGYGWGVLRKGENPVLVTAEVLLIGGS
ncbi:hypothetical protein [Marivita sp. GX14005]|uniref:hypothetical protein n=1 Tax=Marivita sp. GX14005 TaxID=2942276 RepID=UPI0020187E10|nr:hypothetical protein [Marivita sp. GX14005]MCL3883043.1 hypothetical protein [Marivita sp. GX14005]